jgi:hypothetical protein
MLPEMSMSSNTPRRLGSAIRVSPASVTESCGEESLALAFCYTGPSHAIRGRLRLQRFAITCGLHCVMSCFMGLETKSGRVRTKGAELMQQR